MQRRQFIKLAASAPLLIPSCTFFRSGKKFDFPIQVQSNSAIGHLLLEKNTFRDDANQEEIKTLIVGGGVAGVTAAYALKGESFVLCELAERLGGSASALSHQGFTLCQGAHYILNYPKYFESDALSVLEALDVIRFNALNRHWDFVEKAYLVQGDYQGQAKTGDTYRDDVLYGLAQGEEFLSLMEPYHGKLFLPSHHIAPELHFLDKLTFKQYLEGKIQISPALLQAINYQLRDDFGGTYDQVSALTGLYYYASRPYLSPHEQVFSPPQGNYYFIEKMLAHIPADQLMLQHLVYSIIPQKEHFIVKTIHIPEKRMRTFRAKHVIYAGQKHALPRVFPQDAHLFAQNQYAPWLVVNVLLKRPISRESFWQNEILTEESNILGFVDSAAQHTATAHQALTVYYCFSPAQREFLKSVEETPDPILRDILVQLSGYFKVHQEALEANIAQVFMHPMGHAMPIPVPNTLFDDKNRSRSHPHLVYAGVDNSRLPLFLEALDSGLAAVRLLQNSASS